jgi:predicted nucleic acid-binding Zn ribbon protein
MTQQLTCPICRHSWTVAMLPDGSRAVNMDDEWCPNACGEVGLTAEQEQFQRFIAQAMEAAL